MKRLASAALLGSVAAGALVFQFTGTPELDCSNGDGRLCPKAAKTSAKSAEQKMSEFDARTRSHNFPPPGALRQAYEQKLALEPAKASIRGAMGSWEEYGRGPLISSGLAQTIGIVGLPDTNLPTSPTPRSWTSTSCRSTYWFSAAAISASSSVRCIGASAVR